ncbi:MAG: chaperone protein HscB, partial [Flavipsychrobacter sp.]|nr:chaperone protein HscB [Flavipsychrobacter sp.]
MMNYFELYALPVSFRPDAAAVKSKFYELSRTYHPDRFAQAGGTELAEALRMAAMNNDAYKTLKSADATMAYILKMNSLLEDEEKYALPPAFLMEMMDINEAISEYEMSPEDENARKMAVSGLDEQLE